MRVKLKYFAHVRERAGKREEVLEVSNNAKVKDLLNLLHERYEIKIENLLISRNHEYADSSEKLREGDEVAIFPPVSGG